MLALAIVSMLGSPGSPRREAAIARPIETARMAFLHPGHPVLAGKTRPTATPSPAVATVPTGRPPVAVQPRPAKPGPPVSSVGGAAGVEFNLVN